MTLDFIFTTATGHDTAYWSERGELDWYSEYANGDDAGKGILTADWNNFPHGNGTSSEAMRRFERILESAGYKSEWSDQTKRCEHCNGCIQTDPGYYGAGATHAFMGECDIMCEKCIRESFTAEYLEHVADNPNSAVSIRGIDPAKHGYVKIAGEYENGFHLGQNDNPRSIYRALESKGYTGILFMIDSSGQFDMRFSVYARHMPNMTQLQQYVECGAAL